MDLGGAADRPCRVGTVSLSCAKTEQSPNSIMAKLRDRLPSPADERRQATYRLAGSESAILLRLPCIHPRPSKFCGTIDNNAKASYNTYSIAVSFHV